MKQAKLLSRWLHRQNKREHVAFQAIAIAQQCGKEGFSTKWLRKSIRRGY